MDHRGGMPAVSVLMLVHNSSRYVLPAAWSVLEQTFKDLELIIVDNASTDDSVRLLTTIEDPRVRLVQETKNHLVAGGMNIAFRRASGAYVFIADSDDLWHPHRLERQLEGLKSRPRCQALLCGMETIDSEDRVIGREFALWRPEDFKVYTAYSTGGVSPGFAFRREAFDRFAWRPEADFAPDLDFLGRVAEWAELAGDPEVLFRYRRQKGQLTHRYRPRVLAAEGGVRLATARRRAGLDDELGRLVGHCQAGVNEATSLAVLYERLLRASEAEGFPVLAALNARRWVLASRSLSVLWRASARVLRLGWLSGADRRLVWRMFALGPVRAHRLKPM